MGDLKKNLHLTLLFSSDDFIIRIAAAGWAYSLVIWKVGIGIAVVWAGKWRHSMAG